MGCLKVTYYVQVNVSLILSKTYPFEVTQKEHNKNQSLFLYNEWYWQKKLSKGWNVKEFDTSNSELICVQLFNSV